MAYFDPNAQVGDVDPMTGLPYQEAPDWAALDQATPGQSQDPLSGSGGSTPLPDYAAPTPMDLGEMPGAPEPQAAPAPARPTFGVRKNDSYLPPNKGIAGRSADEVGWSTFKPPHAEGLDPAATEKYKYANQDYNAKKNAYDVYGKRKADYDKRSAQKDADMAAHKFDVDPYDFLMNKNANEAEKISMSDQIKAGDRTPVMRATDLGEMPTEVKDPGAAPTAPSIGTPADFATTGWRSITDQDKAAGRTPPQAPTAAAPKTPGITTGLGRASLPQIPLMGGMQGTPPKANPQSIGTGLGQAKVPQISLMGGTGNSYSLYNPSGSSGQSAPGAVKAAPKAPIATPSKLLGAAKLSGWTPQPRQPITNTDDEDQTFA